MTIGSKQKTWSRVFSVTHRSRNPRVSARWATRCTTCMSTGSGERCGKTMPKGMVSFRAMRIPPTAEPAYAAEPPPPPALSRWERAGGGGGPGTTGQNSDVHLTLCIQTLQRVSRSGVGIDDLLVDTLADPASSPQIAQPIEVGGMV